MPDKHRQVTSDDFIAPAGQYRIMKEDVEDGRLEIAVEIPSLNFTRAVLILQILRDSELNGEALFTLCDEKGPVDPVIASTWN